MHEADPDLGCRQLADAAGQRCARRADGGGRRAGAAQALDRLGAARSGRAALPDAVQRFLAAALRVARGARPFPHRFGRAFHAGGGAVRARLAGASRRCGALAAGRHARRPARGSHRARRATHAVPAGRDAPRRGRVPLVANARVAVRATRRRAGHGHGRRCLAQCRPRRAQSRLARPHRRCDGSGQRQPPRGQGLSPDRGRHPTAPDHAPRPGSHRRGPRRSAGSGAATGLRATDALRKSRGAAGRSEPPARAGASGRVVARRHRARDRAALQARAGRAARAVARRGDLVVRGAQRAARG